MVILFGSYYRSEETMCEERGPHLKIEVSPKRIAESGTDNVQWHADLCANWFFESGDWEHSGVAST
ncbi:hypothetical protein [Methylogaea oryzae]|uniref:hypothetical protein n=1 Tax=Methylogaea oryzae TaxID=1295382 RepID=UPI0012E18FBB|nr:hypothetical protein [Methylogaea oryzae]